MGDLAREVQLSTFAEGVSVNGRDVEDENPHRDSERSRLDRGRQTLSCVTKWSVCPNVSSQRRSR